MEGQHLQRLALGGKLRQNALMLLAFVLFWVVLIWGLYDGDVYAKEGVVLGVLWFGLMAGYLFLPSAAIGFIVAIILLDIYLVLKVHGQDIGIR